MPDKPSTIVAYAAGASLAAITLFYVFGPNYTLDFDTDYDSGFFGLGGFRLGGGAAGRRTTLVGLTNPANDCFVNSVLQALAGLRELRGYLIRELHRREVTRSKMLAAEEGMARDEADEMDETGTGTETETDDTGEKRLSRRKDKETGIRAPAPPTLGTGADADADADRASELVTRALKDMLDALNERPIYRKTVSARPFVGALELALSKRVSRNQQDAQEFLQLVVERLAEEHAASTRARRRAVAATRRRQARKKARGTGDLKGELEKEGLGGSNGGHSDSESSDEDEYEDTEGDDDGGFFPFEGVLETQIECQACRYRYRPRRSQFLNLTLQVPQRSSATLNACLDSLLQTEHIDDFRCDYCRLQHAVAVKAAEAERATAVARARLEAEMAALRAALAANPEADETPVGAGTLPPRSQAPQRRIWRHTRISRYPRILAVHLSRSIFTGGWGAAGSTKNGARVIFPERLELGGLLERHGYRLLSIVCHRGSHQSGHYEAFRRGHVYAPYAMPTDHFRAYGKNEGENGVRSDRASGGSKASGGSGRDSRTDDGETIRRRRSGVAEPKTAGVSTDAEAPSNAPSSQRSNPHPKPAAQPRPASQSPSSSPPSQGQRGGSGGGDGCGGSSGTRTRSKRRRHHPRRPRDDHWWRVSDDKVRQARPSEVLAMQREVYLLFYEREQ